MSLTLNPLAPPFRPAPTTTHTTSHANADLFDYSVATVSARSINNKLADLADFLMTYHPLVVCLTETWLSASQPLTVPGYDCYRRDRPTQENRHNRNDLRGYGGVAILVRTGMFTKVRHRTDLHLPDLEATWVELILPSNSQLTKLYLGSVYRPPSLTHRQTDNFFTQFQTILQRLYMPDSMLLVSGNFNARCSEWYELGVKQLYRIFEYSSQPRALQPNHTDTSKDTSVER